MVKCCDIKISDLRHAIEIQEPTTADDGAGGRSKAYTTIKNARAKIETVSGSTRVFSEAKDMPISHKITIRYWPGWSADNANKRRIKFGGRYFTIKHTNNVEERNKYIHYTAMENVPS